MEEAALAAASRDFGMRNADFNPQITQIFVSYWVKFPEACFV